LSVLVNYDSQDEVVYEENVGKNTMVIASKMTTFNPDASWIQAPFSPTLAHNNPNHQTILD
jgi:Protein of unknown function (DUF2950)